MSTLTCVGHRQQHGLFMLHRERLILASQLANHQLRIRHSTTTTDLQTTSVSSDSLQSNLYPLESSTHLLAIDRLPAGSVPTSKVTALQHESDRVVSIIRPCIVQSQMRSAWTQ
jgi:hypothetical protein